jgi:hypothetical protein
MQTLISIYIIVLEFLLWVIASRNGQWTLKKKTKTEDTLKIP